MDFVALPKIELHAHLTGSVSRQTLHEIWATKKAAGQTDLEDPALVMPDGKHDYNLKTFFPLFSSYIYNLLPDPASLQHATLSVLRDFESDGCIYLELRTTPRQTLAPDGTTILLTKEDYVRTILQAINSYESQESPFSPSSSSSSSSSSPPRPRMRTNLLLSVDRRDSPSSANEVLRIARTIRAEGHHHHRSPSACKIVGVDLCGDPSRRTPGDPTGDVSLFRDVFRAAREELGLGVVVHFGEAEASGSDQELVELLSWRPDRLGHVICLSDEVKGMVKARGDEAEEGGRGIGLELCLSCNILAEMVKGGFATHHFGEWFGTKGCWVSLGTDDVGVFGSPLSNEYRLAAEHFSLSDEQVRELARQSIECILGGEEEKARLRGCMQR